MLSPQYFTQLSSTPYEDTYTGLSGPLILFSKRGNVPLAAVQMMYQDPKGDFASFITGVPAEYDPKFAGESSGSYFQAVGNRNNEPIQFVVTNLTNDQLMFNLFLRDTKTQSWQEKTLNEVNLLDAKQSYAIRSDKNNDHRVLLIDAADDAEKVKGELKKSENNRQGTYLKLVLHPSSNNAQLVQLFGETYWKPVDVFFFEKEEGEAAVATIEDEDRDEEGEAQEAYDANESWADVETLSAGAGKEYGEEAEEEEEEEVDDAVFDLFGEEKEESSAQQALQAKTAKLKLGEEKVAVKTRDVDFDISIVGSQPCVLGLCVASTLKTKSEPSREQLLKLATELKTEQTAIFTEGTCVICLEESPNVFFYRCGHQCIDRACSKNLAQCPMCRAFIREFIDVK